MWNEDWASQAVCRQSEPDELFVRGAAAAPRQDGVRGVPRPHRVPGRGARQPDGVGRVGRHDRARAPGAPPQASERHLVAHAARDRDERPRRPRRGRSRPEHRSARREQRSVAQLQRWLAEQLPDRAQPVEVVHVRGQRRQDGRRHVGVSSSRSSGAAGSRARRCAPGRRAAGAARPSSRPPMTSRPAARSRSTPAIARSADRSPSGGRLARLTTSPASGIRSSSSRSTKYAASRSASGSGAATTRNAVPSAWSSSKVVCARCRNPPNSVSNAATNVCMSRSTCAPRILVSALVTSPSPAVISRAGPLGRRQQQPDEPAVEEAGEPLGGVEEVQRDARRRGVDDDQVPAAGAAGVLVRAGRASPSPCTPGCPRTSSTAPRRTGWPGSARPSPGWPGSRPPRRRCASCPASSRRGRPRRCRPSSS